MRIDIAVQVIVDGEPLDKEVISAAPRDASEAAAMIEDAQKFLINTIIPMMENE